MFYLTALVFVLFVQDMSAIEYKCNRNDPCGCSRRPVITGRIINGTRASKGTWTWTVSLRNGSSHFCGGSILDERYVITAAHCRVDKMHSLSKITVCAGANRLSDTCRQSRKIKKVINHPSFYHQTFENDIALLEVEVPFNFSDKWIGRICLPDTDHGNEYPKPGTDVIAVGWGQTEVNEQSNTLQQVTIQVVDEFQDNCDEDSILYNHSIKLCAAAPGKDACHYDSGGPLMFFASSKRWELIGITSYGKGCATEYPGVYTRITAFITWIQQIVNNTSSQTRRTTLRPNATTSSTAITTRSTSTSTLTTTTINARILDPYDNMIAILRNKATKKVLDSNTNKHVYTLDHNGGNYQKWTLKRQNDSTYVLQNVQTTFTLESNNEKVYTGNSDGGNHQKWRFHRQNDGSYVLQNLATSRVLDSNGISRADSLHSNVPDNQKWFLEPTGIDPYNSMFAVLRNKATHKILDSNTHKHVYTLNYNGGNYQKWIFKQQNDSTYILQNVQTSFILDANNEKVYTGDSNGGAYQKWRFHRQNDSSYLLQNLATSQVLDSNGIIKAESLHSNVPDNQKWFLEPTAVDPYNTMVAVLKNKATQKVLDSNTHKHVYTLDLNGGNYQKWTLIRQDYGTYALRNIATSFMLDANNESVYTGDSNGDKRQKWRFHRQNDGTYVLHNQATSRVLDSKGVGKADSLDSNVPDNQKWFLVPTRVDPYNGMIAVLRNKATQKVLDSNTAKHVYTLNYNGGNYQKWIFKQQNDSTYVLQNVQTSFILDANNEKVYTGDFNGHKHQKWRFHRQNDGSYVLQNLATSWVLDSNGISKAESVHSNVPDNQKWFLEGK